MKKQKILVTGSSGMIGTCLCETLIKKGYNVIGVDKVKNSWNKEVDAITIKGNLLNKKTFQKIPTNINMVIHLAANARVFNLIVKPSLAKENCDMIFNLLEFARTNNIKKFMFSSSREVYGNTNKTNYREGDTAIDTCESPYTSSKMFGETMLSAYQKCYGIDFIITRFSNVYGMYDKSDRFIPLYIKKILKKEEFSIFGKDKQLDFTYITDCVDGVIKCINNFNKIKNNTYNIASGKSVKLLTVAKLINKKMGINLKLKIEDSRAGEVMKCSVNINKAKKVMNLNPKVNIDKGINKSVDWYIKNGIYNK